MASVFVRGATAGALVAFVACSSGLPPRPSEGSEDPDDGVLTTAFDSPPGDMPGGEAPGGPAPSDAGGLPPLPPVNPDAPVTLGRPCDPGSFYEPNDSAEDACQIRLESWIEGQVAETDTLDQYAFHVDADVSYTLTLSTLGCVADSSFTSLGISATTFANEQPIVELSGEQYYGRHAFYEFTPQTSGDALLALEGSVSCAYEFRVLAPNVAHDPLTYEPNDSFSTAAPLERPFELRSDVSGPRDPNDYFVFPVTRDVTYTLALSTLGCVASSSNSSVGVSLWTLGSGSSIEQLDADQYFNRYAVYQFTPQATGAEVLLIEGAESCGYELSIVEPSTLERDPATYEPNDSSSTAAPLPASPAVTAQLAFPRDPADHYTFPVAPGSAHTLAISAADCIGSSYYTELSLEVWSPGGEVLQLRDSIYFGQAGSFALQATTAGDELVVVRASESCTYTLSITPD